MEFFNFLGGIAQGIFNVEAQRMANEANIRMVQETNQANRELSELAYQQNIAQWNRENAYNTPSAQMQRLIDAGLNPNLMYGQGTTGTSAHSPQLSYSQMQAPHVSPINSNMIQDIFSAVNIKKVQADTDVANRQADLLFEQSLTEKQKTIYQKTQNAIAGLQLENEPQRLANQLAIQVAEAYAKEKQGDSSASQSKYYDELSNSTKEQANKLKQEWTKLARENDFFGKYPDAYDWVAFGQVIQPYANIFASVVHSVSDVVSIFNLLRGNGLSEVIEEWKDGTLMKKIIKKKQ